MTGTLSEVSRLQVILILLQNLETHLHVDQEPFEDG